jgi:polar amino acid transport system permease protein
VDDGRRFRPGIVVRHRRSGFFSVLRAGRTKWLTWPIGFYVAFVRGTPFVVQIFHYFFHPAGMGNPTGCPAGGHSGLYPSWARLLSAKSWRAASRAVSSGQWEASQSTGLNFYQQMRYVIMPQAMQTILPPLVGQYVLLIKDSSVVSVIGVVELTRVGWMTVVRIPEGLMVFSLVGLLYFVISYP